MGTHCMPGCFIWGNYAPDVAVGHEFVPGSKTNMPDALDGVFIIPLHVLVTACSPSAHPESPLVICNPEEAEVCRCELHLRDTLDLQVSLINHWLLEVVH